MTLISTRNTASFEHTIHNIHCTNCSLREGPLRGRPLRGKILIVAWRKSRYVEGRSWLFMTTFCWQLWAARFFAGGFLLWRLICWRLFAGGFFAGGFLLAASLLAALCWQLFPGGFFAGAFLLPTFLLAAFTFGSRFLLAAFPFGSQLVGFN